MAVLNQAHIPYVAGFMELVVVVALLSAFNANIYGTSRMAYSLSRRGDGPAFMARISNSGVPPNAVLLSVFFGFVSVLLNWLAARRPPGTSPERRRLGAPGHLDLHRRLASAAAPRLEREGKLTVRMWLFPCLSYLTLAMLGGFVVLMLFDSDARTQLISTCVLFLVIAALGVLNTRLRKRSQTV